MRPVRRAASLLLLAVTVTAVGGDQGPRQPTPPLGAVESAWIRADPSDAATGTFRYLPMTHPDLLPVPGTVLVSYSQNYADYSVVQEDPRRYRPRFLRLALSEWQDGPLSGVDGGPWAWKRGTFARSGRIPPVPAPASDRGLRSGCRNASPGLPIARDCRWSVQQARPSPTSDAPRTPIPRGHR